MSQHDDDAIAAFIRASWVTRCPTACVAPTQAVVAAADRLALGKLAEQREVFWEAKREARARHRLGRAEPRMNTDEESHKASPLRYCQRACAEINKPLLGLYA
jgi:hypothetical protein